MNLAFPENISQARKGLRSIRLSKVLAVAYCFGGSSALLASISKFIIMPLFEELTYERRIFADTARNRLVHLNSRITRTIAPKPLEVKTPSNYIERAVPANEAQLGVSRVSLEDHGEQQMSKELKKLRAEIKQMDPNDDVLRTTSSLTSQANELAKYARHIQYETVPTGSIFLTVAVSGEPNKPSNISGHAIVDCIKDIRSFKSSLLST